MFLEIGLWLIAGLIGLWILLGPVSKILKTAWEILKPIVDTTPVDFKSKFGEWAVVTGSTDGIGKAYAKELASRGMNLILISRTLEKLEKTRSEILDTNPKIEVRLVAADFSKGREIFDKIETHLKDVPVGILVNNVGKNYDYPMYLGEVPEDVLWDIININIGAVTLMSRIVINGMKNRGKGAIVNISSGSEMQPLPLMTVYAATKVYIRSFSEALRAEYSGYGLVIQHLVPFFVNTKMNNFSGRLQVSSLFVPDASTYAKGAISTLGIVNSSSGYWAHVIQGFFTSLPPIWLRTKIGHFMNQTLRNDYFKEKSL
ncbi:hypothetical protein QAD02_000886 [Eretmocerus hayati]|uniref:Uncharacterized protein n=1 Tax=Eretmocerus hayati TaxID=131215 RepID=A0ACC2NHA8_9HYME|nr:hypothetical protein QAD02_000886 [Eretmocerus hayati]